MKTYRWMAFFLLLVVAACSTPPATPIIIKQVPTARTQPTIAIEATSDGAALSQNTPGAALVAEASASAPTTQPTLAPLMQDPPAARRTHYHLEALLDYAGHTLAVDEKIAYFNSTAERLDAIVLVVEALRYPGSFQIATLADESGNKIPKYLTEGLALTITLPQPLAPGETLRLSLSYTLRLLDIHKLPKLRPYPLGYTSVQTNLGDWYPFVPPYMPGKGWLVHPAAFYGESLVYDSADFEVSIRFAGGQNNLVVAASAPALQDEAGLRYSSNVARSFAWSVSPYYQVLTQTVELDDEHNATVASYFFSAHEGAGKSLLDTMVQALPLFSRLWGAYPRPLFTGVQADFIDGMEYDGLYFLSSDYYNWHKDSQEDFLVALAAHETAHQWFSAVVGNDQALQPWLDEALCTYSEALYYENVYPPALEWWWAYRVNYYEPQGWVDISIYDTPGVAGQYHLYRDPVYLRGAMFLDELRALVGDEAFFTTLREYVGRYAYRQAATAGFFELLRQNIDQDLTPLLSKYFSKAGY